MSYPTIGDGHKTGGRVVLPGTTRFGCPEGYDPAIWQARVDLAACYHPVSYTHLTLPTN